MQLSSNRVEPLPRWSDEMVHRDRQPFPPGQLTGIDFELDPRSPSDGFESDTAAWTSKASLSLAEPPATGRPKNCRRMQDA